MLDKGLSDNDTDLDSAMSPIEQVRKKRVKTIQKFAQVPSIHRMTQFRCLDRVQAKRIKVHSKRKHILRRLSRIPCILQNTAYIVPALALRGFLVQQQYRWYQGSLRPDDKIMCMPLSMLYHAELSNAIACNDDMWQWMTWHNKAMHGTRKRIITVTS